MTTKKFFIFDTLNNIYFSKRIAYGYNKYNQSVYKAFFKPQIWLAKQFYSETEAITYLEKLYPNEFEDHILHIDDFSDIKFINLEIKSICISQDN